MASDRDAVEAIVTQHGFQDGVAYGHTKLFVRTPRSLYSLEQERAALIPILVLFLQKVRHIRMSVTVIFIIPLLLVFTHSLGVIPNLKCQISKAVFESHAWILISFHRSVSMIN